MENLTISMADMAGIIKNVIVWMAGIGIVVDLSPGIKFQPIRWLLKNVGNMLNADVKIQLDELQSEFKNHQVESWRHEILNFANTCMNHVKHTKEEFDYIIKIHDDYMEYIRKNKLENGQVKVAYEYIEKIYANCMEKNSFLSGKPD